MVTRLEEFRRELNKYLFMYSKYLYPTRWLLGSWEVRGGGAGLMENTLGPPNACLGMAFQRGLNCSPASTFPPQTGINRAKQSAPVCKGWGGRSHERWALARAQHPQVWLSDSPAVSRGSEPVPIEKGCCPPDNVPPGCGLRARGGTKASSQHPSEINNSGWLTIKTLTCLCLMEVGGTLPGSRQLQPTSPTPKCLLVL